MSLKGKRILILTPTLGRYGEINGVAYTYGNLLPLFKNLKDTQVDIVTYGNEDCDEPQGNITLCTHKPRNSIKFGNSLMTDISLVNPLRLKYPIMKRKYDLVHSIGPEFLGALGVSVAYKNKCPLVCDLNTLLDDYAKERYINLIDKIKIEKYKLNELKSKFKKKSSNSIYLLVKGMMKIYFDMADLILVPTLTIKEERKNHYKTPIKVVGRGIDLNNFNPKRRTRKDKKVRALYVGRVETEKNIKVLEKIFGELKIPLTVVGDGTQLKNMKKNLPNAEFTGTLKGKDLYESFANGDFFVFPSKTETLGNVVLQAMASGLPVIVTDKGASKELVVDKVTGFVTKNDEEFREKVLLLSKNHIKRKRMGKKARKHIEKNFYSWEDIFYKQLIPAYESILNKKKLKKKTPNFLSMIY